MSAAPGGASAEPGGAAPEARVVEAARVVLSEADTFLTTEADGVGGARREALNDALDELEAALTALSYVGGGGAPAAGEREALDRVVRAAERLSPGVWRQLGKWLRTREGTAGPWDPDDPPVLVQIANEVDEIADALAALRAPAPPTPQALRARGVKLPPMRPRR